jgi:hypothetical protein
MAHGDHMQGELWLLMNSFAPMIVAEFGMLMQLIGIA